MLIHVLAILAWLAGLIGADLYLITHYGWVGVVLSVVLGVLAPRLLRYLLWVADNWYQQRRRPRQARGMKKRRARPEESTHDP